MKLGTFQPQTTHLFVAHLAPARVFPAIQSASDFQSLRRGRSGDEMDDRFVIAQGLAAPAG